MRKGQKCSEETKRKISEAHIGMGHSEETRLKLSISHLGQKPWNTGLKGVMIGKKGPTHSEQTKRETSERNKRLWQDPEYRKRQSEAHTGYVHTPEQTAKIATALRGKPRSEETKAKQRAALKGIPRSPETIKKMSEAAMGHPAWNKGAAFSEKTKKKLSLINTGKHHSEETKEKLRGKHPSDETRKKQSDAHKGKDRSAETIRKMLMWRGMTRLEKKFQEIADKNNLPYKFVGDGSFMIGRKNPDFININGDKIAIEVYARYYKLRHAETVQEWMDDRERVFREYGWNVIFFDETQVTEANVLKELSA